MSTPPITFHLLRSYVRLSVNAHPQYSSRLVLMDTHTVDCPEFGDKIVGNCQPIVVGVDNDRVYVEPQHQSMSDIHPIEVSIEGEFKDNQYQYLVKVIEPCKAPIPKLYTSAQAWECATTRDTLLDLNIHEATLTAFRQKVTLEFRDDLISFQDGPNEEDKGYRLDFCNDEGFKVFASSPEDAVWDYYVHKVFHNLENDTPLDAGQRKVQLCRFLSSVIDWQTDPLLLCRTTLSNLAEKEGKVDPETFKSALWMCLRSVTWVLSWVFTHIMPHCEPRGSAIGSSPVATILNSMYPLVGYYRQGRDNITLKGIIERMPNKKEIEAVNEFYTEEEDYNSEDEEEPQDDPDQDRIEKKGGEDIMEWIGDGGKIEEMMEKQMDKVKEVVERAKVQRALRDQWNLEGRWWRCTALPDYVFDDLVVDVQETSEDSHLIVKVGRNSSSPPVYKSADYIIYSKEILGHLLVFFTKSFSVINLKTGEERKHPLEKNQTYSHICAQGNDRDIFVCINNTEEDDSRYFLHRIDGYQCINENVPLYHSYYQCGNKNDLIDMMDANGQLGMVLLEDCESGLDTIYLYDLKNMPRSLSLTINSIVKIIGPKDGLEKETKEVDGTTPAPTPDPANKDEEEEDEWENESGDSGEGDDDGQYGRGRNTHTVWTLRVHGREVVLVLNKNRFKKQITFVWGSWDESKFQLVASRRIEDFCDSSGNPRTLKLDADSQSSEEEEEEKTIGDRLSWIVLKKALGAVIFSGTGSYKLLFFYKKKIIVAFRDRFRQMSPSAALSTPLHSLIIADWDTRRHLVSVVYTSSTGKSTPSKIILQQFKVRL
jgi:hypothetical protein